MTEIAKNRKHIRLFLVFCCQNDLKYNYISLNKQIARLKSISHSKIWKTRKLHNQVNHFLILLWFFFATSLFIIIIVQLQFKKIVYFPFLLKVSQNVAKCIKMYYAFE